MAGEEAHPEESVKFIACLTTCRNEHKMVGSLKLQMSQDRAPAHQSKHKLIAAREECSPKSDVRQGLRTQKIHKRTLQLSNSPMLK